MYGSIDIVHAHCSVRLSIYACACVQERQQAMIHEAQRAALVREAAPEGNVHVSREISLSVDLQAVRGLTNRSDNIYLRYSLPALGYMPPVLTAPPATISQSPIQ